MSADTPTTEEDERTHDEIVIDAGFRYVTDQSTTEELAERVREALNRSYDDSHLATSYSNAALAALLDLEEQLEAMREGAEEIITLRDASVAKRTVWLARWGKPGSFNELGVAVSSPAPGFISAPAETSETSIPASVPEQFRNDSGKTANSTRTPQDATDVEHAPASRSEK